MLFTDLTKKTPQEWDQHIRQELEEAQIDVHKFREYDSPHFRVEHTLEGRIEKWVFDRDETIYCFWGDVPLATAEVIAADPACRSGCMPGQWLMSWGDKPLCEEQHELLPQKTSWVTKKGMFRVKDEGQSEEHKEALNSDFGWRLQFVDDPSVKGKPFITTYTFFTQPALNNFMEIVRRHRVEYQKVY